MFCVQIAEVLIAIENRYAFTERLCADYIVDVSPDECSFSVSVTPEEIAAENSDGGTFSPAYCESLAIYRKICTRMLDFDAFLLHAAVISYKGRGFAFAAKSGTGKSTHIAQWMRALGDDVTVVNGDKPILRWRSGEGDEAPGGEPGEEGAETPDGTPDGEGSRARTPSAASPDREAAEAACDQPVGEFIAYGTPYCGKENWGQNTSVPLRAVCFIERCEPGESDRLSRLEDDGEIVARIMNQILMPNDPVLAARQLDLLDRLLNGMPFYVLRCTPTPAAFDAAFQMTLCDNEREQLSRNEGLWHED
ncbi:hypothetical protein [uncultured Ellagibacter sp.]|uniref:hypothetical protein n=1 Tax=uncultured Ellagibacter sp. TaxID=2137580 RepID=UPI00262D080B|nr:hypothetical protein [uncultured Ellagibacter sp.]